MSKPLTSCLLLAIIFLGSSTSLYAQSKATVKGVVTDSTKKPVSYVTIRLLSKKNPAQPVQSTYTKEDGSFSLGKLDTGMYILVFSHTAYAEKKQPVKIQQPGDHIDLKEIQLSASSKKLQDVTVTSQRPLIEQTDDKITFNAEDDPATKTETAIDVLRKTPFITVDGEDNVSINGKTNFKVLLNGRETAMFAKNIKDALRGFPGALIAKIEVITSPSAKYDGEGIGGLINIITKKKVAGYNGTINSFTRRAVDKLQVFSANGNIKMGKFGATAFYTHGDAQPVERPLYNNTIPTLTNAYTQRTMNGFNANSNNRDFGNAELSYEIDSLNIVTAYANVNSFSGRSSSRQTITTDFSSSPSSTSYFNVFNDNSNPGISVGSDYIRKFRSSKERELSFRFFGEFGKNEAYTNSTQDNPGTDRFIVNNSMSRNNQYTFEVNHILPLRKSRTFEAGAKAIFRRASSDFESLVAYGAGGFKPNPSNTDYFKYSQDVVSLYSMYSFKVKKSSWRLGARLEHTTVNGDFITSNTQVRRDYYTLLPNIQYSQKLSKLVTLVMNYSKRIQRPFITDLNPFVNNNDSLNINYGNPDLRAQTLHIVSARTMINKGPFFGAINLEGAYSGNYIMDYSFFEPATGVTKTTSLNIGKGYQANLNININTKLTPKWRLGINTGMLYRSVKNSFEQSQSNEGFGGNFTLNTNYTFNPKFVVSSFFGMFQDPVSIQTTYPFNTWYNVAIAHKFFKNKFNASLRFVNFLEKDRDFKTVTKDPNFTTININNQIRRGVALALTFSFGKLTENVSKKKGVNNDDQITKPQPTTGGQ
jgi:5-hydroxyisourate hydrolase-like protein (transthyretin family)